jgi:uncharacterized Zn-binding protein involved in type VI secretion
MIPVARLGDSTVGYCKKHKAQTGAIVSCSPDVIDNGIGVARVGDTVRAACGHTGVIVSGSGTDIVDGVQLARIGDNFDGYYSGHIVGGSPDSVSG